MLSYPIFLGVVPFAQLWSVLTYLDSHYGLLAAKLQIDAIPFIPGYCPASSCFGGNAKQAQPALCLTAVPCRVVVAYSPLQLLNLICKEEAVVVNNPQPSHSDTVLALL